MNDKDGKRLPLLEPLQAQDIIIPDNPPEWEPKVASVLSEILAGQCLNEQDLAKEEWTLTYEQVKKALHNGIDAWAGHF